ncbi:putative ABC-type sugar transport system,permease component [Vibrio nigripulchritudo MADA3029]|uniref:ABC-type sugar transport system,permease component n=2 Tax=Vibrio nigripulchritudo TaxID=28173 RepID=A0AAV2VZD1_9VIBR|nr:sugar ABC transporter permease [Vibrio nigripulchritudo]EGU60698.1 sugar uptake ABC transporter permease [Vibrio nigripulchritudo ATCC 27043]CCN34280.1 putative ABC-type sugar transport system,permease component [Vibrio nigripulchritudo AM115]CCN43886.1 putative ABC-type sugar transport system,permease component [Vibrio nigripulchritudo FTn2]CCN49223.1 putative ABC-type sugar transport system,permease component [Vibrio nigripulchritudo MADA3020]CCN54207.1 putative ABC-type sugar transport s
MIRALRRFVHREESVPYMLLLPAIITILVVVLLPLIFSLYTSFTPYKIIRPETLWKFIGVRNYTRIFSDADFWWVFARTVFFLTIVLNVELVLGLVIALLVNQITKGKRLLRTVMMFPMMFSPILVGFQFKYVFNDNIGILNNLLQTLGLTDQAIPWLVDGTLAMMSIMVAEIWMSTSVFAILLLAGLYAMPQDPIEAAKVDGCTPLQVFRHITLPFLMPFVFIAMTIRSLDVARAFDIVDVMTGGGPAGRTELLWTLIARVGYDNAKMGQANAMAYVSILLSIFFTFYFFRKLVAARRYMGGAQ